MNHLGDTNKLVSDTPRTDMMEQHAPVGIRRNSAFEQASDFSRQLERELNVANAIIRQQQLLDEENLRLQERIKRLEEAGDEIIWVFCKASVSIRNDRESEALKLWIKARGVKL